MASVTKELHRLLRRVDGLTDGQARIEDVTWGDEPDHVTSKQQLVFKLVVRPNDGYYKGGTFVFSVRSPLASTFMIL